MNLNIRINLDNDDFQTLESRVPATERITLQLQRTLLSALRGDFEKGLHGTKWIFRDTNGNTVGWAVLEE